MTAKRPQLKEHVQSIDLVVALQIASLLTELGSRAFQAKYWEQNTDGRICFAEETFQMLLGDYRFEAFISEMSDRGLVGSRTKERLLRALTTAESFAESTRLGQRDALKSGSHSMSQSLLEDPLWNEATEVFADASIALHDSIIADWIDSSSE